MLALEKIIASFVMPPGLFILLLFILTVYLIIKGKSGIIKIISVIFLLIMIVLSSGIGTKIFVIPLEDYADSISVEPLTPHPVAVPGGGIYYKEGEGAYPGLYSLQRIIKAYRIHNLHGTEIIYSGGVALGYSETSEAEIAAEVLENMGMEMEKFIEEGRAKTTFKNAEYIKKWMDKNKYNKIYLVTSAVHMARSAAVFKSQNINFLPVHSGYIFSHRLGYLEYLPSRGALTANLNALHEWVGLLWYYLTDRI